jgi:ankyrin repeat protein
MATFFTARLLAFWLLLIFQHICVLECSNSVWQPTLRGDSTNCTYYQLQPDALLQATMTGNSELVDCVLGNLTVDYVDNDIQVNIRNEIAETSLMYASYHGLKDIALSLIKFGANLNALDQIGNTALHQAVMSQQLELVALLVDWGAQLNIENNFGETAMKLASSKKYNDIVLVLAIADANTTCVDPPEPDSFINSARSGGPEDLATSKCLAEKSLEYVNEVDR